MMIHCRSASPTPKFRADGWQGDVHRGGVEKDDARAEHHGEQDPSPSGARETQILRRVRFVLLPLHASTLSEHLHLDPGTLAWLLSRRVGRRSTEQPRGPIT